MSRALELLKTMHRSAISTAHQLSTTTLSSRRRRRAPPYPPFGRSMMAMRYTWNGAASLALYPLRGAERVSPCQTPANPEEH